ncbi:hypothetical protein MNBD_GAMMA20-1214, partial [hydrothermal vent metagenome]
MNKKRRKITLQHREHVQTRDEINTDEDKIWVCALNQFFSRQWVFSKGIVCTA